MTAVAGLFALMLVALGVAAFGAAFRANTQSFALLWIGSPVVACLLYYPSISTCLTLRGLRHIQVILMVVVVSISCAMFANDDQIRNRFGKQFVEGYAHWRGEPETDDDGREYYPDHWTAKTCGGRWGLQLFSLTLLIAEFGLPVITWKATKSAIGRRTRECEVRMDGMRVNASELVS